MERLQESLAKLKEVWYDESMSEHEPHITFECRCGRPVQAPVRLAGTLVACPYDGCEEIMEVPSVEDIEMPVKEEGAGSSAMPETSAELPSSSALPKPGPRLPPKKGLSKGGRKPGVGVHGTVRHAASSKPDDTISAPDQAAARPTAHRFSDSLEKKKIPVGRMVVVGVITLGALIYILNEGKGKESGKPRVIGVAPVKETTTVAVAHQPEVAPPAPAPAVAPPRPRTPRGEMTEEERARANEALLTAKEDLVAAEAAQFADLKQKASGNSTRAMVDLADAYRYGRGTDINTTAAAEWYTKAGEKGYVRGWIGLGHMQRDSLNDYEAAPRSLHKAGLLLADQLASGAPKSYTEDLFKECVRDLDRFRQSAMIVSMIGRAIKTELVGAGIGWVAGQGIVITSRTALGRYAGKGHTVFVHAEGISKRPAKVLYFNESSEVVVLEVEGLSDVAGFAGAAAPAPENANVHGMGIRLLGLFGADVRTMEGEVFQDADIECRPGRKLVRLSMFPVNSGAPLINERGEVAAMIVEAPLLGSGYMEMVELPLQVPAVAEAITKAPGTSVPLRGENEDTYRVMERLRPAVLMVSVEPSAK